MRRHVKATSSKTNPREPDGHGASMPSGRLRFAILAATVAAFLLVPAAQAFASEHLKVNIANVGGEGTGSVRSGPNAEEVAGPGFWGTAPYIECKGPPTTAIGPGTCKTEMTEPEGGYEQVFLWAEPSPGSKFVEWTVQHGEFEQCETNRACLPYVEPSGTGEDNSEVTAVFGPASPTLTIAKTGEGTVTSSPAGIICGGTCSAEFEKESTVTLTASPATGYAFATWAGCTEHTGLTCKVKMDKSKTVKVGFVATPTLTIEKAGTGTGKASATGISCDANCSKATSAIKTGTLVTVKVTSDKGSEAAVFEGGTGSASGCSGASCTFTISANSSVKVKFDPISTKTLTVKLIGPAKYKGKVSGKGTVKGLTLAAISCGTGCTTAMESFFSTDTVTLTAVASAGYTFAGWKGSVCESFGTAPCPVATSSNKTVEAEFK